MPNSSPEEFLVEKGLVTNRSWERRQLLGCLGCKWSANATAEETPSVYGYQIARCIGGSDSVIQRHLATLEEKGLLSSEIEQGDQASLGHKPKRFFYPASSPLGQEFVENLSPNELCRTKDPKLPFPKKYQF